jgi:uncharacterized C2H2 Zn-finger protein
MNFFTRNPIFIDEGFEEFHLDDLFPVDGDTLVLVLGASATLVVEGNLDNYDCAITVSEKWLRVYWKEDGENNTIYNLLHQLPLVGLTVSLLDLSNEVRVWILNKEFRGSFRFTNPNLVYSALYSLITSDLTGLLYRWRDAWDAKDMYAKLDSQRRFTAMETQMFYELSKLRGDQYVPYPTGNGFVYDLDIELLDKPYIDHPVGTSVTCAVEPDLTFPFDQLRDKNGQLVELRDWAFDRDRNPFRGKISPEIRQRNRVVIANGHGVILVHCPRCDAFMEVQNIAARQREIIREVNKRAGKKIKSREYQNKADKFFASGARWSGNFIEAREIETMNAINSQFQEPIETLSESDVISDFSRECTNCGAKADEY